MQLRDRIVTTAVAGALTLAGAACSADDPSMAPGQEEGAVDPGGSGQGDVSQGGGPEGAGEPGAGMTETEGSSSY